MKPTKKLSNTEIASFCSQTAMILNAGFSTGDGMDIMLADTKSGEGHDLIEKIRDLCYEGNSFYDSIKSTEVFPEYVLNMVRLGEESGNLDTTMTSLAEYYERQEAIYESIKNAISYPFIMIAMMLLVIVVLITKVLPIFNQVFMQLGTEMNAFSQTLLKMGNGLSRSSSIIIILLVLLVGLYIYFTKFASGRNAFHKLVVSLPFTNGFSGSVACARFASGMALTMTSGLDTYDSLDLVKSLVDDPKMQEKIDKCRAQMQEGDAFPEALEKADVFSNLYNQMVSVGFKTGSTDVVMKKIADNYEQQIERKLHSLIAVLEPSLVIVLSFIVGLILLSVILPLMGIMSSIG